MSNKVLDYIQTTVVDWILFRVFSYLYLHYWHSWVNNDYAKSFFAFILIK